MKLFRLFCLPSLAASAVLVAGCGAGVTRPVSPGAQAVDPPTGTPTGTPIVSRAGATVEAVSARYAAVRGFTAAYVLPILPPARAAQLRLIDRGIGLALGLARTAATVAERRAALDRAEAQIRRLEAGG